MKNRIKALPIALLSIAFVFTVFLTGCFGLPDSGDRPYNVIVNKTNSGTSMANEFTEIVSGVRTACVDVYAQSRRTKEVSIGSGVIFGKSEDEKEYYIITNHHVIDDKSTFSVTLLFVDAQGNESNDDYSATLLGSSKKNDIAVLKINKKGNEKITTAPFGDSDAVSVSDAVFAIGNPLGVLGGTVSKGIISSKARTIYLEDIGSMTLIQTDTATYEGSSGGALFNEDGEVIGITNSGYSEYDGLNFAIPSNNALFAANALISTCERSSNGTVLSYGYVPGESNIGVNTGMGTCQESRTSTKSVSVVYVHALDSDSDFKGKGVVSYTEFQTSSILYFHALSAIEYTDDNGRHNVQITSSDQAQQVFSTIPAGATFNVSLKRIRYEYTARNKSYRFYLDSGTEVKSVTTSQYRYVPPVS